MTGEPGARIRGVLETSVYVDDLEVAAEFYSDVLGLEMLSRAAGRHVFFRCGNGVLLLFDPVETLLPGGDVPPHGAQGPGHVAFSIEPGDLAVWEGKLRERGVELERVVQWPRGGTSLYLRDPSGNSLELTTPDIWGLE